MPMTAVPQLTALSHAFGALAAALVGTAEFYRRGRWIRPWVHDGRAGDRDAARLSHLHRQHPGVRQTAGDRAHAPHHLSRAELRQSVAAGIRRRSGRLAGRCARARCGCSRPSRAWRCCSASC